MFADKKGFERGFKEFKILTVIQINEDLKITQGTFNSYNQNFHQFWKYSNTDRVLPRKMIHVSEKGSFGYKLINFLVSNDMI